MYNKNPLVILGISGGVDSSVAALLLKKQGYNLEAVFMQNWQEDNDENNGCSAGQDLRDAQTVCESLDIALHVVNFSNEYWYKVFQYFLDEYAAGRTPNPDVMCNKEIKFRAFLDYAKQLGAQYIATGHYARNVVNNDQCTHSKQVLGKATSLASVGTTVVELSAESTNEHCEKQTQPTQHKTCLRGVHQLLKGIDTNKDQSYFLYTLGQEQLPHVLFPLGRLTKQQVREIAREACLVNHDKKDSTGICFIGERKFKKFLGKYLLAKPGEIVTADENVVIGQHDGIMFYTLGQRHGLGIGGKKNGQEAPWYVVYKDLKNNRLLISQNHDHPLLLADNLHCNQIHWIAGQKPQFPLSCGAKIRYRQQDQKCMVHKVIGETEIYQVKFARPQWAITPGQAVVFYKGNICLGGGTIVINN